MSSLNGRLIFPKISVDFFSGGCAGSNWNPAFRRASVWWFSSIFISPDIGDDEGEGDNQIHDPVLPRINHEKPSLED
jgi:hypothetical protein